MAAFRESRKDSLSLPQRDGNQATTLRHLTQTLGLRLLPPATVGGYGGGLLRYRHSGTYAHRRGEVASVPASGNGYGGGLYRCHAPCGPYERPGGPPAQDGHFGRGYSLGTDFPSDRHNAGQCLVGRPEISLRGPRTSCGRGFPRAIGAHERLPDSRGRGPLHLAVGLRFPALIPAYRDHARGASRRADSGAYGFGHARCGEGYYEPSGYARGKARAR